MATVTQAQYDELPWQEVESSNIARVAYVQSGHDATDPSVPIGTVYVEFASNGGERAYAYANVAKALYDDLLKAASIGSFFAHNIRGSFFAHNIRGRFEHERVEVDAS